MSIDSFDRIVKTQAARHELDVDWQRQRATAKEFCLRFAAGSDTQMLGDQVGMGKTYVAMAVAAQSVLGSGGKVLLITPPSAVLRAKWEQEIRAFGSTYLHGGAGSLRPLVVSDYWDLVANLHDHSNAPLLRVTEGKLRCVLYSLWKWAVKKEWVSNHQNWWPQLQDFDRESGETLKFYSDYCIPAWEAFLEKENAERNNLLKRLLSPKGTLWTNPHMGLQQVKELFKSFTTQQDRFEPNVFILSMNSLRRPRRDSEGTQRFAGFVLSELLRGKWEETCKDIVKVLKSKRKGSVISPKLNVKQFPEFRLANLYNSAHCVEDALAANEALQMHWDEIQRQPRNVDASTIVGFFSDLMDAVVQRKLHESNISLAVVDEVHNWKGNAHGSSQFRASFADAIPSKLLMTATPLQMGAEEMVRIFSYAASAGGQTAAVLDRIRGKDGLVSNCLAANDEFVKALQALTPAEGRQLANLDGEGIGDLRAWMDVAARSEVTTRGLATFYLRACNYKTAVDMLLAQQGRIMIRHTKNQSYRSFHAGSDFRLDQKCLRSALYAVDGMSEERHELVNYIAMRLDQRLRDVGPETARAHLVRGLTSSHSAYRASRGDISSKVADLPGPVRAYMELFEQAIQLAEHPKVSATAAHAVANYHSGKKTLIFCERVSTVYEIQDAIRKSIESGEMTTAAEGARTYLLENKHLFIDVQLHRSWCASKGISGSWNEAGLCDEAAAFALACLHRHGTPPTPRRVLRLLDLWFIRHEVMKGISCGAAAQALAKLADDLENGDAADALHADVVLASKGGKAAPDEAAFLEAVEDIRQALTEENGNLWAGDDLGEFDRAFWTLLDAEASLLNKDDRNAAVEHRLTFYRLVLALETGLRRVALRPDFVGRFADKARDALPKAIHAAVRVPRGDESVMQRIVRYIHALAKANGTINALDKTNTARRSLWRGVDLDDETIVQALEGSVPSDKRVRLCAAFNSPLAPDILICTGIGSEGIDLHRECAEIIHHDLPWNPAKLEQRIGRIDRVGRLGEGSSGLVRIGIPFLAQNYDQFQYERVLSRAKLFEVLLGKPAFDANVDEEVYDERESGAVRDSDGDDVLARILPVLPEKLTNWLRVDLSLAGIEARQTRTAV